LRQGCPQPQKIEKSDKIELKSRKKEKFHEIGLKSLEMGRGKKTKRNQNNKRTQETTTNSNNEKKVSKVNSVQQQHQLFSLRERESESE